MSFHDKGIGYYIPPELRDFGKGAYDLFKAVNKQGIKTTSQTVGQPRTQTPLSDDKWAKFEAAVSAPKKRSGGGV